MAYEPKYAAVDETIAGRKSKTVMFYVKCDLLFTSAECKAKGDAFVKRLLIRIAGLKDGSYTPPTASALLLFDDAITKKWAAFDFTSTIEFGSKREVILLKIYPQQKNAAGYLYPISVKISYFSTSLVESKAVFDTHFMSMATEVCLK